MSVTDDVDQLRSHLSIELGKRPVKARTQIDVINERLRKAQFDRLDAAIRALPAAEQEVFRIIQHLLEE